MIRDKKRKLNSWWSFTFIWTECVSCHKEFRFESVWKFTKINTMCVPFLTTTHMICKGCAENRIESDDFADTFCDGENLLPARPKVPAAPPKKPEGPPNVTIKPPGIEWVNRG